MSAGSTHPAADDPGAAQRTRPASSATSKRTVVSLGVLAAVVVAVSASQRWGTGHTIGSVVGISSVDGTGGEVAPVVPGLALVGGAAAVAAATTGRIARRVAVTAMALAGLAVVAATLWTLHDLPGVLGDRAAQVSAASERIAMTADATPWPWLAVAGGVLLALGSVLAAAGLPTWALPSHRYERPGDGEAARERSLWERVGDEDDTV